MKYIHNLRGKNEQEVLNALGDAAFPLLIGGGDENEEVKVFIDDNQESLNNRINTATDIQEAFNITYKPYIINGYDQRISLTSALGYAESTWNVYQTGIMTSVPYFYNYSKVSPLTFTSSDTNVATIDSNGVVTIVATGTTTITASFAGNDRYKPYSGSYTLNVNIAPVVDPEPEYYLTHNGHKYVDLGLPSGTMWATYNMGSTALNEYGDSYFWGNTNPITTDPEDYNPAVDDIYAVNVENKLPDSYSKYNDTDNKRILDMTDDAARVNWGGNWRVPSRADFAELHENTNISIVSNYLGRGADGVLFTSKNNNNELFFPFSDNGSQGAAQLHSNELAFTNMQYIWMCGAWWDLSWAGIQEEPEDVVRWYPYRIRPVFTNN